MSAAARGCKHPDLVTKIITLDNLRVPFQDRGTGEVKGAAALEKPMKMKTLTVLQFRFSLHAPSAQTPTELTADMRAKWNAPSEPFAIIDNVYYVGTADLPRSSSPRRAAMC